LPVHLENLTVIRLAPVENQIANLANRRIYQVKYINITQATDRLGQTGDYPAATPHLPQQFHINRATLPALRSNLRIVRAIGIPVQF